MPQYKKYNRPPIIYRIKQKGGHKRGFLYGGHFIELNSPLTDEELIEDIVRGFDIEDKDEKAEKPPTILDTTGGIKDEGIKGKILANRGLYDDEIGKIANEFKLYQHGFLGIVPIDKIHTFVADMKKKEYKDQFGFIFNTDPSNKPGQHWIAVAYVKKNKELDYYNSLAEPPTDQFLNEIKPVIDALNLPYYLKFKVNEIARQNLSQNCGYFAIDFLIKILVKHQKFKFASGYSDVRNGEKKINKFKTDLKKFGYIG